MEELENGVNETEPAEQSEEVEATEVETDGESVEGAEVETEEEPALDRNAIYADARRKAEAEARRKQEALDAAYADKFKGYTNPITGKPITSAQDYYEAMLAQEQMQTKKTLEEKGIDPEIIEKAVENSPAIRTANAIIQEQQKKNIQTYLDEQVREISKIDPDIKTAKDIEGSEKYSEILDYLNNNKLSLVDAYKLVYAEKLADRRAGAVKQQAVNNAKSQQHLVATGGGTPGKDNLVEIPEKILDQWREFFGPDVSYEELRQKYNDTLH